MDRTLFNYRGEAIAYIADDYKNTIYLWNGTPVAYLYEERQIFGINGRHLAWFINEIIYNERGERIGFTFRSCPVTTGKEPVKHEKQAMDEIRPRWQVPPTPNLSFGFSEQPLNEFLIAGQVTRPKKKISEEAEKDEED